MGYYQIGAMNLTHENRESGGGLFDSIKAGIRKEAGKGAEEKVKPIVIAGVALSALALIVAIAK